MSERKLTHLDEEGQARMVDVGAKDVSQRTAVAEGRVHMSSEALCLVKEGSAKGDVLQVARIAGIQAAKRTADLIPLCHPLPLDSVAVELLVDEARSCVVIKTTVSCTGRTGVEMEALTAASVAALTVYDMVKAVDRSMTIEGVTLLSKTGGRRGPYERGAQ